MDQRFQELVAFKQQHRDISDTSISENSQLEGRINMQITNESNLQTDHRDDLKSFHVTSQENLCNDQWEESYHLLSKLFIEHGRAFEPDKNAALGLWAVQQRNLYSIGLLHPALKDNLDAIGFSWTRLESTADSSVPCSTATSGDSVVKTGTRAALWNAKFAELGKHHNKFGHCVVSRCVDKSLFKWLRTQRQRQKDGILRKNEEEQLNSIGFVWNDEYTFVAEQIWANNYMRLKAFREEHTHCVVNHFNCIDKKLIAWVRSQRRRHHERPDRVAKLDLLGFVWKVERKIVEKKPRPGCVHHRKREEMWDARYELVVKHRQQYGHTCVTRSNPALHQWVAWQRKQHVKGKLCKCRLERLNNIQFAWSDVVQCRSEQDWDTMYDNLKAYHEEHGTCRVSRESSDYRPLGQWVYHQHIASSRGALMPDQKAKLDLLGFFRQADDGDVLQPVDGANTATRIGFASNLGFKSFRDEQWEVMYERLKAYKEKHGHCRVRNSEGNDDKLRLWLSTQRSARRMNHRPDRMARLDLLGFYWNDKEKSSRAQPRRSKRGAGHLDAKLDNVMVAVDEEEEKVTSALVENSSREKLVHSDTGEEESGSARLQDDCASEKATIKDAKPVDLLPHNQKAIPGTLGCDSTPPAIDRQDRQKPCDLPISRPCKLVARDEHWNQKYVELVKSLPSVQRDFETTYSLRKRRRLLECQAPIKRQDLTEDLEKDSFPIGSIGLRVIAKLQEKKQKANSTSRFRRNCGL